MKRFHVHLAVGDLEQSTRFYTRLFGLAPTMQKPGYAKWMLEDPRVNFAISAATGRAGLQHLGLQADTDAELSRLRVQMADAGSTIKDEKSATCCYAVSDKHWAVDPQGVTWEAFHTLGEANRFGDDHGAVAAAAGEPEVAAGCCPGQATACC